MSKLAKGYVFTNNLAASKATDPWCQKLIKIDWREIYKRANINKHNYHKTSKVKELLKDFQLTELQLKILSFAEIKFG